MNINKIKSTMFSVKGIFLIYFEILLILRAVGPYLLLPHIIDTVFFWSAGFAGSLIIFVDFILTIRERKIKKYDIFLVLFIVVMLISSLVNLKYGILGNIKLLMWQIIFFFLVFQFAKDYGYNRWFKIAEKILVFSWFVIILISLGMFITKYGIKIPIQYKYYPVRIGWLGNRLFGIFTDPNFGAVTSIIVIFIEIKNLIQKKESAFVRFFCYFNIVLQFLFIVLSGSRTAEITLIALIFFFTFFIFKQSKIINSKSMFKQYSMAFFVAILSVFLLVGISYVTEKTIVYLPRAYSKVQSDSSSKKAEKKKEEVETTSLARPDTESGDVSNRRFKLWSSTIEIAKKSPLVGGSPAYYIQFAHDRVPYTLMGQDNLTAHNLIFLVLAGTGGTGVLIFFIFLMRSIFKALLYCFKSTNSLRDDPVFYSIIFSGGICLSALFITELVLVSTIGSFVFWLSIGLVYNKPIMK
ncbi:O-antigen ligase family protein [Enterococcus malodoratus]|uniref:O-antigen ligase family protein n=1 Tax=Enterococcus malodoratus TaxID=71451 RepID=UPI0039B0C4AA